MATGEKRIRGILNGMKQRCYNPKTKNYYRYGGRGIFVCDEWRTNTQAFIDWSMSQGYADDLTIDRIDNDSNYEPGNCRWATQKEQQHNRSTNVFLTYNGKTQDLKQWADELGIYYLTLWHRYKAGWDTKKIIEEPVHEWCRNRYPEIVFAPGEDRQLRLKEYQRRQAGIRSQEKRIAEDKEKVKEKAEIIQEVLQIDSSLSVRQLAKVTGIPRSTVQRLKENYLKNPT